MTATPAVLAAIPAPADAVRVEEWEDWNGTGNYDRHVHGTRRSLAGVEIRIAGSQRADGAVTRHALVWATDAHLDAAKLRQVAAIAYEAAAELDRLAD